MLVRLIAIYVMICLIIGPSTFPLANAAPGDGVVTKVCEHPPKCFASVAAREQWAKENHCKFLEDVCEKTPPKDDNKGAKPEDSGFWGSLWDSVSGALTYGYEFAKGLVSGLKGQITDVLDLVSNPMEVVDGLVTLGKAFYDDPKGTLAMLGELLGQEAVDTIHRATECGAYDLGKVIGSYVSPAVVLKLATRLGKYSGKLADAVKDLKVEYGCASFVAGTPVVTPQGSVFIERIVKGTQVASRSDESWVDAPQEVEYTFGRVAPSYRIIRTERETYQLTDEHPLWVQGKGWTEAKDVTDVDVLASRQGDVLVLENTAIQKPVRVYNFSVARTPNYFVGQSGLWVHNAPCRIELHTKAWDKLTPVEKGYRGEWQVFNELKDKGYEPVGKSFDPKGKSPDQSYAEWVGQTGIDGIYKDKSGNYIIMESKATGGEKPSDPAGCKGKLCTVKEGERQMSDKWINERLEKIVPDPVERQKILDGLKDGSTKKVYAQTDAAGTTYHEIDNVTPTDVKIGDPWNP